MIHILSREYELSELTLLQKLFSTKPIVHEDHHDDESFIESDGHHRLHRSLGVFSLTMIGVGATIGTGIFFTMVEAVPKAGPSVILSFLLAALTAGLTALCYAELSSRIPASGSSYSYAYATVGEFAAFIVAACLLLEYGLAASATAIGWSDYLNHFLTHAFGWQIPEYLRAPAVVSGANGTEYHWNHFNLPPVILVLICGILLVRGTKESALVNTIMVLIKLFILSFFVIVAFSGFNAEHFTPFFNPDTSKGLDGIKGVTAAAGTVFFSFIGLDTVATAGGEVKNPKRNVPLGILAALLIVTVFYMLVSIAALGAQPAAMFQGQEAGLAVILQNVTGKAWPALILSAGAVISVFSVTLVTIYGQSRILYAISKDGLAPKVFQTVHGKTKTPVANTVIVCVLVGIVAGLVDATFLWDMVSMGTLVAFMVVSIAVPVMRAKRLGEGEQGFRVPFGAYLVPGLSVAACLYIIKDLSPATFHTFFIWMTIAVFSYFAFGIRHSLLHRRAHGRF